MFGFNTGNAARYETLGANTADTSGVTLTASATANVKGSWVNVGSATSFTYEQITVFLADGSATAAYQVDIGITVGAERYIIVPDLTCTPRAAQSGGPAATLPIHVPAGAQLAARCRSSSGGATIEVVIVGSSSGLMGTPGFSFATKLFADSTSTSRGVSLDIGSTVQNSEPAAYTLLVATSPARIGGIVGLVDNAGDTARAATAWLVDIAVGSSGSERDIVQDLMFSAGALTDSPWPQFFGPFSCDCSSGMRFAARARNSVGIAGDRAIGLSLYGLVP